MEEPRWTLIDRLHAEPRTAAIAAYGFVMMLIGCVEHAEPAEQPIESRLIIYYLLCWDLRDTSTSPRRVIQMISRQPQFGLGTVEYG